MAGIKSKFLYLDAKEYIIGVIAEMKPGDRIPSRNDLMKAVGVTRTTIDRAISELIGEHYLYALDGSGTYVRDRSELPNGGNAVGSWGVLISNIISDTYPEILRGIEDFANGKGNNIIICNTDNNVKKQQEYIKKLIASNVCGLIIIPPVASNPELESYYALKENGIPFVFCNRYVDGIEAPKVISNNFYGAFLATRHLVGIGHKRIAFLGPPTYTIVEQRLQGYMSAMAEAALPIDWQNVIFEEKRDYRSMGYLGMNKLLGQPDVPSAVLCFNDSIAFGAYKAIAEKGLRVPGDVALVGYDDSPICDMMPVGLTTVKYPKYETGKCASELLWELTAGESRNANQTVILNPELIIRETCGAGMRGAAGLEDEHTAV